MIVRKIRPEEIKRTGELFSISFEFAGETEKSAEEIYEEVSTNPQSREDAFWTERWAAFEDDDKTMMSYFIAQPFPVHFDGEVYQMTGIGGVATLPQYRRNGGIRKCFEAALPSMYEDGVVFSYLYPFSSVYYRKFGYEMGCEKLHYHVELSHIKPFAVDGKCYLVEPGNFLLEEIKEIYRTCQNKYNMMIANEDYEFAWVLKSNPVKNQEFTYVYKDGANAPLAYMTVKQVNESDGRNLLCTRFCFANPEGFKGLMNILIALGSDHRCATFDVPGDVDLTLLIPEWSMGAVSVKRLWHGMVRVINVEKALLGARYIGAGSLTIAIEDKQIAENNRTFEVIFQEGRCSAVILDSPMQPDIRMGINEFSRLMIGTCDVASLPYMDGVTVENPSAPLHQVFFKKPNMIMEYF